MTKEEIKNRIEEIKDHRFNLAMIDRWTREIFEKDSELVKEQRKLEKELERF